MQLNKLKILSLFSGAGGMDLGFIQAGHNIVYANDFDYDSYMTYKNNIGNHITNCDVKELGFGIIPNYDLLIAGFPCQGFSLANINKKDNDQRNNLYLEIIRALKTTNPKFFLLENVRGIKSINGGKDFNEILKALDGCGYDITFKVMNAADYGVPQTRIRLIINGVRKDLKNKFLYTFPAPTHDKNSHTLSNIRPWVTISEALKDIPEPNEKCEIPNHVHSNYKVTNRNFTGHRNTDGNKPSPTILARGNGGGGVCAIQHPKNHRRMTVRESAIIQTFPMDFIFTGKLMSMYRQVGNAVAVNFAKKLALGFFKK